MATAYTYNSAGLVTNILSNQNGGSGGTLNTDIYSYDAAGNRVFTGSYDGYTVYGYDAADQIVLENHATGYPAFTATYTYDRNGNRLSKSVGGQTDTYTYQANAYNAQVHTDRLAGVSGGITGTKSFGYDALGNVRSVTTNGSTLYLSTDYEDRATRLDFGTGPGQSGTYATARYNGLGLRVSRHGADGADHALSYDGSSPGASLLASGSVLFTPGLMQRDATGPHVWQTDALGSVRGMSNVNQAPEGEAYYDAWGQPFLRQGTMPGPLGWAGASGYQTDADTGLMLLGNRYYDPSIGRFLSQDPAKAGGNWYAYCSNDPLGATDPTGLSPKSFDAPGDASQAQVEAMTWLHGGQAGESYDVSVGGKVQYSFTLSNNTPSNSGWNLAIGVGVNEFVHGTSNRYRHYGPTSSQSRNMRNSIGFVDGVLRQIAAGQTHGSISTPKAAWYSLSQPSNGTQFQVGAYKWSFTNPNKPSAGIDILNDITFDSLAYHIPDMINNIPLGSGLSLGLTMFAVPEQWSSGRMGTIHQDFHLNFP